RSRWWRWMTVILDGTFEREYLVCDTRPVGQYAPVEKGIELLFGKIGQACPRLRLDLGQEGLEVFLYDLVEGVSSGLRRS
ncbi:MAG: hypothetical protein ACREYC_26850, partial [Gammaproteobacteria bacterium]